MVEFAETLIDLFGATLTGALVDLQLPSLPLPELAFDLDEDGVLDVRLEIVNATVVPVDTTDDGESDWVCILTDLQSWTP